MRYTKKASPSKSITSSGTCWGYMTNTTHDNEDTTLLDLFTLGHKGGHLSKEPTIYFKGAFVCAFAGQIFRRHKLRHPQAFFCNDEGLYQFLDQNNVRHGFQIVKDGLMIMPLEGADEGQRLFFARHPKADLSDTENFCATPPIFCAPDVPVTAAF